MDNSHLQRGFFIKSKKKDIGRKLVFAEAMQKFNSTGNYSDTLPRDAELQLRLADCGGAGDGKENGAGKHFLPKPEEEENSFCTKRKMLVGLDVLCLCIGKNKSIFNDATFFKLPLRLLTKT